MIEVAFRLEGATVVRTDEQVLVTWIRELPVDKLGVSAVRLDKGIDAEGRAVRLVSRMSEIVSE